MTWVSPVSGRPLAADTPHSLTDGTTRWPVVCGIPFLRVGREELAAKALAALDADEREEALVLLLADQDDWWAGPAAAADDLRRLVREYDTLTLREAMALLGWGPVADYFAYRWVDPTYLAGLALLEAHWTEPATCFELACGIGHYARELTRRGVRCLGADVVFAKCWLAKHWVAPEAEFVCFDAADSWPVAGEQFDLVHCQDAFYFLPEQEKVAARLREAVAPGGVLAVAHLHNADHWNGAKGPAKSAADWAAIFPDAVVYDEHRLLWALAEGGTPEATGWHDDQEVEAWSVIEGGAAAKAVTGGLALPTPSTRLRPNPLMGDQPGHEHVRWPSDRYRDEYQAGCLWANRDDELPFAPDPVRLRRLVDLPERW